MIDIVPIPIRIQQVASRCSRPAATELHRRMENLRTVLSQMTKRGQNSWASGLKTRRIHGELYHSSQYLNGQTERSFT